MAEGECYDFLTAKGYEVRKRGWPDFLAWKGDELIIVEVKPKPRSLLKTQQQRVMQALANHGLSVFRYDPESKLEPMPPLLSPSPQS